MAVDTYTITDPTKSLLISLPNGGNVAMVRIRCPIASLAMFAGDDGVNFSMNQQDVNEVAAPPSVNGAAIPKNNGVRLFFQPGPEYTLFFANKGALAIDTAVVLYPEGPRCCCKGHG